MLGLRTQCVRHCPCALTLLDQKVALMATRASAFKHGVRGRCMDTLAVDRPEAEEALLPTGDVRQRADGAAWIFWYFPGACLVRAECVAVLVKDQLRTSRRAEGNLHDCGHERNQSKGAACTDSARRRGGHVHRHVHATGTMHTERGSSRRLRGCRGEGSRREQHGSRGSCSPHFIPRVPRKQRDRRWQ